MAGWYSMVWCVACLIGLLIDLPCTVGLLFVLFLAAEAILLLLSIFLLTLLLLLYILCAIVQSVQTLLTHLILLSPTLRPSVDQLLRMLI